MSLDVSNRPSDPKISSSLRRFARVSACQSASVPRALPWAVIDGRLRRCFFSSEIECEMLSISPDSESVK